MCLPLHHCRGSVTSICARSLSRLDARSLAFAAWFLLLNSEARFLRLLTRAIGGLPFCYATGAAVYFPATAWVHSNARDPRLALTQVASVPTDAGTSVLYRSRLSAHRSNYAALRGGSSTRWRYVVRFPMAEPELCLLCSARYAGRASEESAKRLKKRRIHAAGKL